MAKKSLSVPDEKNQSWVRLIREIVHDLTTPLAIQRLSVSTLVGVLPTVFKGYQLAVEHQLIEPIKNPAQIKLIQEEVLPNMEGQVGKMLKHLNGISAYVQQFALVAPEDRAVLSMREMIETVLKNYPFADEAARALVHVEGKQDFKFKGFAIFMQHLLSDLLDNALYHIKAAEKGEIYLTLQEEGEWNILTFTDTGPGISPERLPDVFKRFISIRNDEVKAGLGFCRHVILETGGSLQCESVLGAHAQFILKFPFLT